MALLYWNLPMHNPSQHAAKGGFYPIITVPFRSVAETDILSLLKFRGQWTLQTTLNLLRWLTEWLTVCCLKCGI